MEEHNKFEEAIILMLTRKFLLAVLDGVGLVDSRPVVVGVSPERFMIITIPKSRRRDLT